MDRKQTIAFINEALGRYREAGPVQREQIRGLIREAVSRYKASQAAPSEQQIINETADYLPEK